MKRQMKNLTYRNLMAVIRKIQKKGYDFEESERLARGVFDGFLANPQGLSIEGRIGQIMDREDFEREYGN